MANHRLIAVSGMPGSGKGEVVTYLTEDHQFAKVYFGGVTLKEIEKRGFAVNEANEKLVRSELRAEYGMAAFALLSLSEIREKLEKGNVVIDGLYSWEEYLVLKREFPAIEVLAIWAPPELRYERLAKRLVRPLTREEAIARDHDQLENAHTGGPIAMADMTFRNLGMLSSLHNAIDMWLQGARIQC